MKQVLKEAVKQYFTPIYGLKREFAKGNYIEVALAAAAFVTVVLFITAVELWVHFVSKGAQP